MDVIGDLKNFGIDEEDVLNIYPFGSRVYGSNNEKSDYDFWVIVKDSFKTPENGYLEVSKENVDLNIYKYSTFIQKVSENELQALICAFLPEEKVILQKVKIIPNIKYIKLKKNVFKEASRHLHSLTPRLYKENNIYQAKKMECQSLRDLLFGIQIVKYGKIIDYSEANCYFGKDIDKLYEKFTKEFTELIEPDIQMNHSLETISFIKQFGMNELNLYYDIFISKKHFDYDLFILNSSETSPNSKNLVHECSGLVVNGKDLISFPLMNIYFDSDYYANRIDWKSSYFSSWIEGFKLIIFYYKDRWILHSKYEFLGYFIDKWIPYKESNIFKQFDKIWNDSKYEIMKEKDYCFNFVLNSKNGIINYDNTEVILVGVRDLISLKEIDIQNVKYNWKKLKFEKCESLGEVTKKVYEINPIKEKGYIINDSKYNRIKVIAPQYQELLKFKDSKELNIIFELICRKTPKEFLLKYENIRNSYDYSLKKYQIIADDIQKEFEKIKDLEKKDFSKLTEKSKYKNILRKMKDEKEVDVKDFLFKSPSNILEKLFNITT